MSPFQLEFTPWLAGLYAASVYAFMLLLAQLLLTLYPVRIAMTQSRSRYGSIDGLRGILATGVFVHHTYAAHGYFTTGVWNWSGSVILNQLGQTTVAMFFMITGFLFTIKASSPDLNWRSLYISRLARLAPLYWLIVTIVFGLAYIASNYMINEPVWMLMKEFFQWLAFVCCGRPDINGLPMSWTLLAGVNWSLQYEVLFYIFAIPVIHFVLMRTSTIISFHVFFWLLTLLLLFRYLHPPAGDASLYIAHFLGGMLVARAYVMPRLRLFIGSNTFRVISVCAFGMLLTMIHARSVTAVVATAIIFAAVVGGASLFGVLDFKAAVWLGDISYGIYLIHGLILWITLTAIGRTYSIATLSLPDYWSLVLAVSATVTLLATLSYVLLEKPVMNYWSIKSRKSTSESATLKASM